LACLSALKAEFDECEKWLKRSLEMGKLPTFEYIQKDTDFDSILDQDWFKNSLERTFGNKKK
jgi:hypothetical protein